MTSGQEVLRDKKETTYVPGRGRMVVDDWKAEVLKGQFSVRKRALAPI